MQEEIQKMRAAVFNALAHPLRIKILEKLREGPCCVCNIIPCVGGEQSNVSHHLAILRKSSIVRSKKRGVEVWYEVTDSTIFDILDLMSSCVLTNLKRSKNILESTTRRLK
jgi:ArsR family transcriptional regulator